MNHPSAQTEPLEIKMNTLPAALFLVLVGLVGAYLLSDVLMLALGLLAFCAAGAGVVAWAGKRGVILRVTPDQLVYGGIFPKTLARQDVAQIQPTREHIAVTLHDGRNITIGQGFHGIALVGARLVDWPETGRVGPSPVAQMLGHG